MKKEAAFPVRHEYIEVVAGIYYLVPVDSELEEAAGKLLDLLWGEYDRGT
jgi:hypothetical protein